MSRATKPVFGVSDQVRHKSGCAATKDGLQRSEVSSLDSRGNVLFSENKGADVTAKLTGVFVFASAKSGFLMTRLKHFRHIELWKCRPSWPCGIGHLCLFPLPMEKPPWPSG